MPLGARSRLQNAMACVALLATVCLDFGPNARADDSDLFQTKVAPNVVLMVDNSGSMNHVVWHPDYDPEASNGCSCFSDSTHYLKSSYGWSGCGSGDHYIPPGSYSACGNTREIFIDPVVATEGNRTRWSGHYLNWYFSDAADSAAAAIVDDDNGMRSACLTDPSGPNFPPTYAKYRRSRTAAAKEVLREVVCQVNAEGDVRFGLAKFYRGGDPEGGYLSVPVDDYTPAQASAIDWFIDELEGEAWTPLGETLYNVYRYFQSRSNRAVGKDGSTTFPKYNIKTNGYETTNNSLIPPSPAEYTCQKNFVIVITDGEPTRDDFDGMSKTTFTNDLIGDYNPDNADPENGNEVSGSYERAWYLDDIAKFMQENDFQLDLPGDQNIDVYTVGFTTSDAANALLQKAAEVGNGLFFQSNNAEELTTAIVTQVTDIIEKAQAFTSATVPSSRTTHGDSFYFTYFLPKQQSPFWEGHLKSFGFDGAGDVVTPDGRCAAGTNTTATPPCTTNGLLRTSEPGYWDAADEMPAPASRRLFVEDGATAFGGSPPTFAIGAGGEAAMAASLNLWEGIDDLDAPYSDLAGTTSGDMAVALVDWLRGCEFGSSPCLPRVNDANEKIYLGDIFHSNPLVVGSPSAPINEASYVEFANAHRDRPRVIYAGANDGFLHGFHAGTWQTKVLDAMGQPTSETLIPPRYDVGTGEELMGFMPYAVRDGIKELPKDLSFPRGMEAVDGSPVAADVWLYRPVSAGSFGAPDPLLGYPPPLGSGVKTAEQWRTVLIGNLRDGGQALHALDISDPIEAASESSNSYPRYLWGFPCESCGAASNPASAAESAWIGNTWSDPVITKVRVLSEQNANPLGFERWVAIFGAGYHPSGDPDSIGYRVPSDPDFSAAGRGIYIVDITTGEVLAKKVFTASDASIASAQYGFDEMRYAFAAAPTVFDLDYDGFADVIYIGDIGGNLWKWVIRAPGDDPINNSSSHANVAQPNWPFRLFFRGSASTEPPPEALGQPFDITVHHQSFFYPATGVRYGSKLHLAFGAGERNNPVGSDAEYDDGLDSNNNHYYVVRDDNPLEGSGTPPDPITDAYAESDLADFDAPSQMSCTQMKSTKQGYFITGRDAEKFITNSLVFLGDVFTASFVPPDPDDTASVCASAGDSYLYRFDLECGVGAFLSEPGGPAEERRRAIGSGVPTRPRVSVGCLNQGGGSGCKNKVVVITSDASIENIDSGNAASSGIKIRAWRDR
ncbi:MAG: hypothetical protein VCB78_07545 [Myxococcota bacterium]